MVVCSSAISDELIRCSWLGKAGSLGWVLPRDDESCEAGGAMVALLLEAMELAS